MPVPGEQHKAVSTSTNPFEEVKPHINEYTAKEIATLSSRLEKQLGPEYISSRPGAGGGKVHYLSADKCINLANEVFGFNGWSSGIQNIQVDFVDEHQTSGKVSLGLSVIVRVSLRDGTYHEDVGYGHIENCKGKAAAFEKAKKEGTTDALKRALRNFGNMLGNCVYDKDYVARVTKLKVAPSKWDPENLHRHPDFAPTKRDHFGDSPSKLPVLLPVKKELFAQSGSHNLEEPDDEFGSDGFDEVDLSVSHGEHPDEIALEPSLKFTHTETIHSLPKTAAGTPIQTTPQRHVQPPKLPAAQRLSLAPIPALGPRRTLGGDPICRVQAQDVSQVQQVPQISPPHHHGHVRSGELRNPPPPLPQNVPRDLGQTTYSEPQALVRLGDQEPQNSRLEGTSSSDSSDTADHDPPIGFYTARAAESVQNISALHSRAAAFDPHLESPSIRKSAGVDHTKTKPVGRESISIGAPLMPVLPSRSNAVNPQADKTRRVGMPAGVASPLQNRGSYKPPQMKRTVEGAHIQPQPLRDVTVASVNIPTDVGGDVKRQKTGPGPQNLGVNPNAVNG